MKHYHGKTRDEIIRNPNDVGLCYRMIDSQQGQVRQYFCRPNDKTLRGLGRDGVRFTVPKRLK